MSSSSSVNKFIGLLLFSREQAHVYHLTTTSFSAHRALQTYYEGIVPLLDSYAETYMGKSRKRIVPKMSSYYRVNTDARSAQRFFIRLARSIQRLKLPRSLYLDNIRQEIDAMIRQTVYMLSLR